MKVRLISAAVACLLALGSVAQAGTGRWYGSVNITGDDLCGGVYAFGMTAQSELIPQLTGGQGPTGFTMMFGKSALTVIRATGDGLMRGQGGATTTWAGVMPSGAVHGETAGSLYNFVITPAVIGPNTKTITITGFLYNVAPVAQCAIAISGTYSTSLKPILK